MGRLRARTNISGVVGVGALAMEAARGPEGVSIIHHSNCGCNPGFALISCQVFPLVTGARSLSSDVARSSIAGCGAQIPLLLLMWLSLAKTTGLRHRAVASLLAGGSPPPYRTIRKMQPYIITTCWTRLAVNDTRHLGKLPRERSEQLLVARMPSVRGHNASAMRAHVAREGPFGGTRFLYPCKVHGNFRAVTLLNPSVGKQRGMANKWITVHTQPEPVPRKRVLLSGTSTS